MSIGLPYQGLSPCKICNRSLARKEGIHRAEIQKAITRDEYDRLIEEIQIRNFVAMGPVARRTVLNFMGEADREKFTTAASEIATPLVRSDLNFRTPEPVGINEVLKAAVMNPLTEHRKNEEKRRAEADRRREMDLREKESAEQG